MSDLNHYAVLADVFEYPRQGYPQKVRTAREQLAARWPEAACELDRYIELLPETDLGADLVRMQELFIRSFDVQAITTLDIGYVLFWRDC